jgi:hypothetical protein
MGRLFRGWRVILVLEVEMAEVVTEDTGVSVVAGGLLRVIVFVGSWGLGWRLFGFSVQFTFDFT